MGTIRQGANGGFKGKAGSVIGSSWKSINYIKGLYKKRTKPASQAQLEQQEKFKTLMRFLLPINIFLQVGFGRKKTNLVTPINAAFAFNLEDAVQGTYPNYALDYSKIRIADGLLFKAGTMDIEFDSGEIMMTWSTATSDKLKTHGDDLLYILLYHAEQDEFMTTPDVPAREDGSITFAVPQHLQQGELHVWYFMSDRTEKMVSKSSYLGTVTT